VTPREEGFPIAMGGTFSIPIMTEEVFEPGQIVRAELPKIEPNIAKNGTMSKALFDLSAYPWRLVPENYTAPGTLLHTHLRNILENNDKWKSIMKTNGTNCVDAWLTYASATSDSDLTTVLLGVNVLQKMGLIAPVGKAVPNPYTKDGTDTLTGGLTPTMDADEVTIRLAKLFGLVDPDVHHSIAPSEKIWFNSLARIISMTVHHDPKNRNLEFGYGSNSGSSSARLQRDGRVDLSTSRGQMLNLQINHDRVKTGATLQALDEYTKNRVGRVISGPNRKKYVDVVLEKSNL
jgi:hypothetical protein